LGIYFDDSVDKKRIDWYCGSQPTSGVGKNEQVWCGEQPWCCALGGLPNSVRQFRLT